MSVIKIAADPGPPPVKILSARTFLDGFTPIESIVDGLPIGRGSLVSITGRTGHAKTTLSALLQVCLVTGRRFAGREVTKGSVLVLAGENPDDYAMHLAATLKDLGITAADLQPHGEDGKPCTFGAQLLVVSGTFPLTNHFDQLEDGAAFASDDGLVAVFVDTSAAFNLADDENDNVAMRRHASMLRELTALPGRPTVFVLCHPTKSATQDNLLPRGGGAFINEVDANLCVWKDDTGIVTLHWAGKIRGPSFDPVRFELASVTLDYMDNRGRQLGSVAARHVADEQVEQIEVKELDDENRLLLTMLRNPAASVEKLAMAGGFTTGMGVAHKSKVSRLLQRLAKQNLVSQNRARAWELTREGSKEAENLR